VSIVEKLSKQIIDNAAANGANAIVVACPMCHSNLDMRQKGMQKHFPGHKDMPILYLSELIGLALGIPAKELGLDLHFISVSGLLETVKN
jgi:heterodisulfide reductase subunit B